jgi:copper resistance protein C
VKVAAAIVAVLALVALPGIVLSHAALVSADPPVGGTLTTTPYTLTATFDDELTPDGSSILVENANGDQVAQGTVSTADAHVQTAELPALPDGEYTVRWTAVSADDAAVERGTYTFNVGSAAPATITPAPSPVPIDGNGGAPEDLYALLIAGVLIAIVVGIVIIRGRR